MHAPSVEDPFACGILPDGSRGCVPPATAAEASRAWTASPRPASAWARSTARAVGARRACTASTTPAGRPAPWVGRAATTRTAHCDQQLQRLRPRLPHARRRALTIDNCDRCLSATSGWSYCSRECEFDGQCNGGYCVTASGADFFTCQAPCSGPGDVTCPYRCVMVKASSYAVCDCTTGCNLVQPPREIGQPCRNPAQCRSQDCHTIPACSTTGTCDGVCSARCALHERLRSRRRLRSHSLRARRDRDLRAGSAFPPASHPRSGRASRRRIATLCPAPRARRYRSAIPSEQVAGPRAGRRLSDEPLPERSLRDRCPHHQRRQRRAVRLAVRLPVAQLHQCAVQGQLAHRRGLRPVGGRAVGACCPTGASAGTCQTSWADPPAAGDERAARGGGGARLCARRGPKPAPVPVRARTPSALSERLDGAVCGRDGAGRAEVAGLAVRVERREQVLLDAGYGLADVEAGAPMRPDHVFRISSISKPFTAAIRAPLRGCRKARARRTDEDVARVVAAVFRRVERALADREPDASAETLHRERARPGRGRRGVGPGRRRDRPAPGPPDHPHSRRTGRRRRVRDGEAVRAGRGIQPPGRDARSGKRLRGARAHGSLPGAPPIATDRLSQLDDGRLELRLKRAWRDGTTAFVFTPHEIIERLVAIVPRPRAHLTRYFGVLAPAFAARSGIVPAELPPPRRLRARRLRPRPASADGRAESHGRR